ncbi:unnamed protein product [Parnassius apollo]|uniref:(apollo) hypothetical protein n=1 Tax=Parnassius apollo TaxID=110799 RepID=A0A8S3WPC2_PARAO|nr:unnamed protein product [Parnassius apollo]
MDLKPHKVVNMNEDHADSVVESWITQIINEETDDEDAGQSHGVMMPTNDDIHNSDREGGEFIYSEHNNDSESGNEKQPEAPATDDCEPSSESNLPLLELSRRLRTSSPAQENLSDESDDDQSIPAQNQNYYYGKNRYK